MKLFESAIVALTVVATLGAAQLPGNQCIEGVARCSMLPSSNCTEPECTSCDIGGQETCYYTPAEECRPLSIPQAPVYGPHCPPALEDLTDLCLYEAAQCFVLQNETECTIPGCSWCTNSQIGGYGACVYTPEVPCDAGRTTFNQNCPDFEIIPSCLEGQARCSTSDCSDSDCSLCDMPRGQQQCIYTPSVPQQCEVGNLTLSFNNSCPDIQIIEIGDESCAKGPGLCAAYNESEGCDADMKCTWCSVQDRGVCLFTPQEPCEVSAKIGDNSRNISFGPTCPTQYECDVVECAVHNSTENCEADEKCMVCNYPELGENQPTVCISKEQCQELGGGLLKCPTIEDLGIPSLNVTTIECAQGASTCSTALSENECNNEPSCSWCDGASGSICSYTPSDTCSFAGFEFTSSCPSVDCPKKVFECAGLGKSNCAPDYCAVCEEDVALLGKVEQCRYAPETECQVAGQTYNKNCGSPIITDTPPGSDGASIHTSLAAIAAVFCLMVYPSF